MGIKNIFGWMLGLSLVLMTSCGGGSDDGPDGPKPDEPKVELKAPEGKKVYIPNELKTINFADNNSQYSWARMKYTDDVILLWARGFGDDLSKAPSLQGNDMRVNADNLMKKVQEFYDYYYKELKFIKPGVKTKANDYRMMVMLDYSLEGTAYGGTYDDFIGALWIAPNRVQDEKMNCIAHELGHSFQLQIAADGYGYAWGGCGFYEMTSQWMLWQVNPDWTKDEYYHLEAFKKLTHKEYLHIENIYHSPYVLEMWGQKHGTDIIAELYRNGKNDSDPVYTYKKLTGLSQEQFNDEMYDNYAHLVNFDIDRVRQYTRSYTKDWKTAMVDAGEGWKRVAASNAPENYGFNFIPLTVPEAGKTVKVSFRGEAGQSGYVTVAKNLAGWRYGFVAVDSDDKCIYGEMQKDAEGTVSFTTPSDKQITRLWLVVMGAPTEHKKCSEAENAQHGQWPYSIKVE